jgi:hypothetical protein
MHPTLILDPVHNKYGSCCSPARSTACVDEVKDWGNMSEERMEYLEKRSSRALSTVGLAVARIRFARRTSAVANLVAVWITATPAPSRASGGDRQTR